MWQPETQWLDVILRFYWQTSTILNSDLNQPDLRNDFALVAYLDRAFSFLGARDYARIGQDSVGERLFSQLQDKNDEHCNDGDNFEQMVNHVIVIYHYVFLIQKCVVISFSISARASSCVPILNSFNNSSIPFGKHTRKLPCTQVQKRFK